MWSYYHWYVVLKQTQRWPEKETKMVLMKKRILPCRINWKEIWISCIITTYGSYYVLYEIVVNVLGTIDTKDKKMNGYKELSFFMTLEKVNFQRSCKKNIRFPFPASQYGSRRNWLHLPLLQRFEWKEGLFAVKRKKMI